MNPWLALQQQGQQPNASFMPPKVPANIATLQQLLQSQTPGAQAAKMQDGTPASGVLAGLTAGNPLNRAPASDDMQAIADDAADAAEPNSTPVNPGAPVDPTAKLKALMISQNSHHTPLAGPEDRSLFGNMLDKEQGDVDKLREMADQEEAKPNEVNLSPVAALVDSWYGTNLQKGYTPPASPEERAKHLAGLRQLAAQGQQAVTKDQLSLLLGSDKSESNLMKAVLAASLHNSNQYPEWRKDRLISSEVNNIHKAPNLTRYTDYTNRLGGDLALLNSGDTSNKAVYEVLQSLSQAITRSNTSSDYRQKQLDLPTVESYIQDLKAKYYSDPDQPAPDKVVKYVQRMAQRVFDVYQNDIAREAKRMGVGKKFRDPDVQAAINEVLDYYRKGDYVNEQRHTYNLPENQYPIEGVKDKAAASGKPVYHYSPSRNKTKITYPDGHTEIKDGHLGE